MRRRCSLGTMLLAIAASLVACAARAQDASSADAMLQQGARLSHACVEPKPDWAKDKLSSNFDTCNEGVQALVKAMELSKEPKTAETATTFLTLLNVNLALTALRIGRRYAETDEQKLALAFLHVACTSFDAVASFDRLTPDQTASMKDGAAVADRLLAAYHTNCKAVIAPDQ